MTTSACSTSQCTPPPRRVAARPRATAANARAGTHIRPLAAGGVYAVSANDDPEQVTAVSASQASSDEWYRRQITY